MRWRLMVCLWFNEDNRLPRLAVTHQMFQSKPMRPQMVRDEGAAPSTPGVSSQYSSC